MSDKPKPPSPMTQGAMLEYKSRVNAGARFYSHEMARCLLTIDKQNARIRELEEHARALRELMKEPA